MRVTRLGAPIPLLTMATGGIGATGPSGYVLTSNGSNATYWGENIARITANGSNANTLIGPFVNIAAGPNISLATSSNTLTITSIDPGVTGLTSNGSNSLAAAVNLQAGAGIALGVNGQNIIITNIGGVSGGGSGSAPVMVRGQVSSAGAVVRGSGYSSAKIGTGHYRVTFTIPFAAVPVVVVTSSPDTPAVSNGIWAQIEGDSQTTTTVEVYTVQGTTGNLTDSAFNFLAIAV